MKTCGFVGIRATASYVSGVQYAALGTFPLAHAHPGRTSYAHVSQYSLICGEPSRFDPVLAGVIIISMWTLVLVFMTKGGAPYRFALFGAKVLVLIGIVIYTIFIKSRLH